MPNQGDKRISGPFYVSNALMGLPYGAATIGKTISEVSAQMAGREVAKKVTGNFIPGLNIAMSVVALGAIVNAAAGNNGIKITLHEEYVKYFSPREGYYIEGWDIKRVTFSVY